MYPCPKCHAPAPVLPNLIRDSFLVLDYHCDDCATRFSVNRFNGEVRVVERHIRSRRP
jgi:hypothetical protein